MWDRASCDTYSTCEPTTITYFLLLKCPSVNLPCIESFRQLMVWYCLSPLNQAGQFDTLLVSFVFVTIIWWLMMITWPAPLQHNHAPPLACCAGQITPSQLNHTPQPTCTRLLQPCTSHTHPHPHNATLSHYLHNSTMPCCNPPVCITTTCTLTMQQCATHNHNPPVPWPI